MGFPLLVLMDVYRNLFVFVFDKVFIGGVCDQADFVFGFQDQGSFGVCLDVVVFDGEVYDGSGQGFCFRAEFWCADGLQEQDHYGGV